MSNYLTDIDPIGEDMTDGKCRYCGERCVGDYCNNDCKKGYIADN